MTPNDPRHGEPRGYYAHLRDNEKPCEVCRVAVCRYVNLRRMGRIAPQVPSVGTARRLRALMAIGWDQWSLASELGYGNTRVSNLVRAVNPTVTSSTAARVAEVFERLSASPRNGTTAARYARTHASQRGWQPPLAWDDIDHDPEPSLPATSGDVDEVVVERILAGDRLPATPMERVEVVRRWVNSGRPLRHLEQQTGWNVSREASRANRAQEAA